MSEIYNNIGALKWNYLEIINIFSCNRLLNKKMNYFKNLCCKEEYNVVINIKNHNIILLRIKDIKLAMSIKCPLVSKSYD